MEENTESHISAVIGENRSVETFKHLDLVISKIAMANGLITDPSDVTMRVKFDISIKHASIVAYQGYDPLKLAEILKQRNLEFKTHGTCPPALMEMGYNIQFTDISTDMAALSYVFAKRGANITKMLKKCDPTFKELIQSLQEKYKLITQRPKGGDYRQEDATMSRCIGAFPIYLAHYYSLPENTPMFGIGEFCAYYKCNSAVTAWKPIFNWALSPNCFSVMGVNLFPADAAVLGLFVLGVAVKHQVTISKAQIKTDQLVNYTRSALYSEAIPKDQRNAVLSAIGTAMTELIDAIRAIKVVENIKAQFDLEFPELIVAAKELFA